MGRRLFVKDPFHPLSPCLIEGDAGNSLQYVYPAGLYAYLEHRGSLVIEVGGGHSGQRRSVFFECCENCLAILLIRLDEDIEVFGAARFRMNTNGMSADHKVLDTVCVKYVKEVSLVLKHARNTFPALHGQIAFQSARTTRTSDLLEGLRSKSIPLAKYASLTTSSIARIRSTAVRLCQ